MKHKLVRKIWSTGHEEFSFDEFIAIAVVWIGIQIVYSDECLVDDIIVGGHRK